VSEGPFGFIDSHAHLADPAFAPDADAVVDAAVQVGALGIVCIGESREAAEGALALAGRHPGVVFATAGVHPYDAGHYDGSWIAEALDRGAVAVGECGLDYHHEGHAPPPTQRAALADQIRIAAARGVPVVLHTRDAEDDTRDIVRDAGAAGVRGVLHCYTGSHALAEVAVDAGWSVSFSGIITFNRWTDDALVRLVPDDRLLAETDAPYLAPVPVRGRRNEPQYARYTVARLAAVRGTEVSAMAAMTTANARRLFGLATA
jgi:TatD DNase family protein